MLTVIARIGLVVAALGLSACGFHPLYATNTASSTSPQVTEALSAVTITPIADRDGVRLRQALRERMQPQGLSNAPRYALSVQLVSQVQELGVRRDATASHANLIYTARFSLTEGGRRIYGDTVQSIVSYNILDDQYATVTAVGNAGDRAIKQVGDEIKMRLAIFFEHRLHEVAATNG
jgi:LPS-assembly lipoprotein